MTNNRLLLSTICLLVLCTTAYGQRPTGGGSGDFPDSDIPNQGSGNRSNRDQQEVAKDTFGLFYFTVENINEDQAFQDTFLNNFQQYDPTRLEAVDYANLGILGSAHHPLFYEPAQRRGLDIGIHQFDLYKTTGKDLRYYRQERPYTDLRYVQGTEQSDGYLTARFSRNFANGLNFVLDYYRFSQIGTQDQYPNQKNRNTGVALGLWYHAKNGRYDSFFSFAANTYEQQDNGGVLQLPILSGEFDTPSSALVYLNDAQTRQAHREFMYTQYYRLGGRRDSTGNYSRAFTLSHQVNMLTSNYKSTDVFDLADTSFYDRFPILFTDLRGNRHFLRHQRLENSFRIATFKRDRAVVRASARRQRDLLEFGLTHIYNFVDGEPRDTTVNNLLLTGRASFQPGEKLRLDVQGNLNLLRQVGDYRFAGQLYVDLGVGGELQLGAITQRYAPTLVQKRFYLNTVEIWNNFFDRTLENTLSATYVLPLVKVELMGRYHLINNYIYFDTDAVAKQITSPVSILQFRARRNFRFGAFRLDNTLAYQTTDEEAVQLPTLFGKHSLYFDGQWFKVLNVQLGADVRYLTAYQPYYYNPITGQFQRQEQQETPFYPNLDAFFSMRVRQFRAFFKWENITSSLGDKELFYLTAEYPFPDMAFRFGIRWRMID